MSRDIKFRAWNTEAKYMIQDPTSMGSVMREHVRKALDLNGKLIGGNYELIQFTGLKNKNGVDIFDGDVLRYYSDSRMSRANQRWWMGVKGESSFGRKDNCRILRAPWGLYGAWGKYLPLRNTR